MKEIELSEDRKLELRHQKMMKELQKKNKKWRKSKWNNKKKGKFRPSVVK